MNAGPELEQDIQRPVFVARQPVFDRDRNIWGFELLFRRTGLSETAEIHDPDVATSMVISDGFHLARPAMPTGAKALINFPTGLLLQGAALALPPESCVIELLESVPPTPEVLDACDKLRDAGYAIALDDYIGRPGLGPLLAKADIVKMDVRGASPQRIIRLFNELKVYGCKILAEKVEEPVLYELCRDLGFDMFQGFFFSKPEIIPGKKLSPAESTRLRLLQEIGCGDHDPGRLSEIISQDISISYKLLRHINSMHFNLSSRVDSIDRAASLMGPKRLLQWLRVNLLSELDAGRGAPLVAATAAQRARFLETLAGCGSTPPLPPSGMFLLGLLSLLDALLAMPMAAALEELPLHESLSAPLLGEPGPAADWLDIAARFERAEWDAVIERLRAVDIPAETAGKRYAEAMAWAKDILRC